MDISYLGTGGLKLNGKQISLLCDPPSDRKSAADVTIFTSPEVAHDAPGMVIDGPGEYEVKGAFVTGVPAQLHVDTEDATKRGTVYLIDVDGVSVAFVGNIAPKLSNDQVEVLGGADVLAVPVGGHGLTLDATAAIQVISQVEPKYVIPTHYDDGASKYPMPQDDLTKFVAEMGATAVEPIAKLKVNSKEMPLETALTVLNVS